ncbi:MAG: amidase family protein, partial [Acetobacteraceae bacterium]
MATTLAMSWEEWGRTDGLALAELVRTGKLTRGELVTQAAAGVARVNPRLEAVIEVFDDVLADPGIDKPDPAGALAGVPIFLKDLGSGLKGRRQEAGSALLAGTVLGQTDPLVANYLRAGMVPLGRSTTPEFGLTFDTVTDYRGGLRVSRNPWNLERTPGGSSGGSAAVVAAVVTPIS